MQAAGAAANRVSLRCMWDPLRNTGVSAACFHVRFQSGNQASGHLLVGSTLTGTGKRPPLAVHFRVDWIRRIWAFYAHNLHLKRKKKDQSQKQIIDQAFSLKTNFTWIFETLRCQRYVSSWLHCLWWNTSSECWLFDSLSSFAWGIHLCRASILALNTWTCTLPWPSLLLRDSLLLFYLGMFNNTAMSIIEHPSALLLKQGYWVFGKHIFTPWPLGVWDSALASSLSPGHGQAMR